MARDWESVFTTWSTGPSATEQERADNTERQIREAIAASPDLKNRSIVVFTQGSYRNRVNVRRESDVDIGVLCLDTYFPEYPDENVKRLVEAKSTDSVYTYRTFKNEIEQALVNRFGRASVTRGAKAFDVKANTYRVEADVCAFFEHRRYTSSTNYHSGVEMLPDDGKPHMIRNWPEQHYANGVAKNGETARMFKRVVRILKTFSNEMTAAGHKDADVPSFLIECLAWNCPNQHFDKNTYKEIVRSTLAHIFNSTLSDERCSEWGEVSELKYLFRSSQPWTRAQAHRFASRAWDEVGYQ